MLPSKGIARLNSAFALRNQVLARASVRSIPRHTTPSARQFGTNLRSNGTILGRTRTTPLVASRIAGAGIIFSQSILFSPARRFASTDSTAAPATEAPPAASPSEFSPDIHTFSEIDDAALLDFPERVGYLAQLGLDYGWGPTSLVQWVLEHLHFTAGLPWWASIVGVAVVTRLVMFYPVLGAQEQNYRLRKVREDPLYKQTSDRMMVAMATGQVASHEVTELRLQMKMLNHRAGVQQWKVFMPMLQLPLAIGGFKLFKAMGALPVPGLENGGILWFTDLTVPDPFFLLPSVGVAVIIMTLRLALPTMQPEMAKIMKFLPWVFGPIGFLATMGMPASVQIFLAASAVLQVGQTRLLMIPLVRRAVGLPALELENHGNTARTGATYQPPRTMSTTARESSESESEKALKSNNPFQYFKSSYGEAKEAVSSQFNKYTNNSQDPVAARAREAKAAEVEYEQQRLRKQHNEYMERKAVAERKARERKAREGKQ